MHSKKVTELETRKRLAFELFVHLFAIFVGMMIFIMPTSKNNCILNLNLCFVVFSLYCFLMMTTEKAVVTRSNYVVCGIWLLNSSLQALNLFLLGR